MKPHLVRLALAFGVLLLGARSAQAQLPSPEGQPCAAEPTDQLIAYGDHVNPCQIAQVGDSDLFRFQGVTGEIVSVRVTDQAGGFSSPACNLELFRPVGTLVTSTANNTICEIRTTLDSSGLFTARVSESGNNSQMTFTLEIDRLTPYSSTASSINPGGVILGARVDPRGDADLFVFNGLNGDVVSLRATDQAGGFSDPAVALELFRPDGTLAASIANNTIAIIDTTLDQTGVFTIRVTESGNDSAMTYNLEYQCLVGSCPTFHKLSVGRTGAGTVTSSPVGINCGTDCSERYFSGTVVTLTATPDPLWNFHSWTGNVDCVDGVVTMTAAVTCHATFVWQQVDVVIDFGSPYGLWLLGSGSTWQHLHGASAQALATGDFDGNATDDLVVDFGDGLGVYVWMNHTSWIQLHTLSPVHMVTGDLDGDGRDEIVLDFTDYGVWIWANNTNWSQLHGTNAAHLATGDLDDSGRDEVIIDFPGFGIWVFSNNTTWTRLHPFNATMILTADVDGSGRDDVVIDFSSYGLWSYYNNATWGQIHPFNSARVAGGDLDDNGRADLVIDFGPAYGLWILRNNTTWTHLHSLSAQEIVMVDRDGNGKDEVVIDFGQAFGLWQYANDSA